MGNSYVLAAMVALSSVGSYWVGYRVATGSYEERLKDVAIAISEAQNEAVERYSRELEAERKRFAAAEKERAKSRQVAKGIINEAAANVAGGIQWSDAQRLRLSALYSAYGYDPEGISGGVQNQVRSPSELGVSSGALGATGIRLGGELRSATQ